MAQFNVSTTGLNVTLSDLGITLNHPTTVNLYDDGGFERFSPSEIMDSIELQEALTAGTLTATNENGDPITQISPDVFLPNVSDGSTVFYSYFSFWAEESAALQTNAFEWSWGNGDESPAGGGLPVPVDCELYAISVANSSGTGPTVEVYRNGSATGAVNNSGGQVETTQLVTPVAFTAGDAVDFQTRTVGTGTGAGTRVGAHFRVNLGSIPSVKGDKGDPGDPGQDGMGGVPNTFARVVCSGNTNVNATGYTEINLSTTASPDTIGVTIASNEITLPAGTYEVRGVFSVSSTVQRSNQEVRMLIGGVEYSSEYGEAYIRSTGNHNEAKISYTDIFTIGTTSDIRFESRGIASTGTVALDGSRSKILIHKIA